jgi:hypothetical protein
MAFTVGLFLIAFMMILMIPFLRRFQTLITQAGKKG